jgi:nucleoside-diphosphate-sugar epimerase
VLVTGATGFVGSYVLRELLRTESRCVAILVRAGSRPGRIDDLRHHARVQWIAGDLGDLDGVRKPIEGFSPQAVVHLAWLGVAGKDRDDRDQLLNIDFSQRLLDLSEQLGVGHWIGLGSHAEYGPCSARIAETQLAEPTTLYGATKLGVYHLAKQRCRLAGIRFAWLRLFNSYGPADHDYWLIPYLIGALLRRERPRLTAGHQRWDFIHVRDAAAAIVAVADTPSAEGCFNLGSGQSGVLREIVERVRDLIDPTLPLGFGEIPYRDDQVMFLEADTSRLTESTGWRPAVALDEGLREMVEWYREHGDHVNA